MSAPTEFEATWLADETPAAINPVEALKEARAADEKKSVAEFTEEWTRETPPEKDVAQ